MSDSTTITTIVDRVTKRFPRIDSEVTTELTSDMYEWIKDLCSEFPFWFLHIDPGNTFPGNFPLSDITDLDLLTHYKTDWLDRGWLHVKEGQEKYLLAAPAVQGRYDADASKWDSVCAQKIKYVKEYNQRGNFLFDLEVQMSSRASSRTTWSSTSRPQRVLFETGQDSTGKAVSWLRFNPVPDKDYIYQVAFVLNQPISYGTPLTNRFMQEGTECCITYGMLFCAEYFNEMKAIEYYRQKLYGNDMAPQYSARRWGYIEKLKRDTRRKTEQEAQTIPQFKGAGGAVGRVPGGQGNYPYRGTYYGRDGFS